MSSRGNLLNRLGWSAQPFPVILLTRSSPSTSLFEVGICRLSTAGSRATRRACEVN